MKLSVITDEISQDFEHALDVMAEYGVTGAELRGLWSVNIADLSANDVILGETLARRPGNVRHLPGDTYFQVRPR